MKFIICGSLCVIFLFMRLSWRLNFRRTLVYSEQCLNGKLYRIGRISIKKVLRIVSTYDITRPCQQSIGHIVDDVYIPIETKTPQNVSVSSVDLKEMEPIKLRGKQEVFGTVVLECDIDLPAE